MTVAHMGIKGFPRPGPIGVGDYPPRPRVLLDEQVANNNVASLDFTKYLDGQFDEYELRIVNAIAVAGSTNLALRWSTNYGATFLAGANYRLALQGLDAGGTAQNSVSTGTTRILLNGGNDMSNVVLGGGWTGMVRFFGFGQDRVFPRANFWGSYYQVTSGDSVSVTGTCIYAAQVRANAMQVFYDSTNISSGRFTLFGVQK